MKTPYEEGRDTFYEQLEKDIEVNPYNSETERDEYLYWICGWNDAAHYWISKMYMT